MISLIICLPTVVVCLLLLHSEPQPYAIPWKTKAYMAMSCFSVSTKPVVARNALGFLHSLNTHIQHSAQL